MVKILLCEISNCVRQAMLHVSMYVLPDLMLYDALDDDQRLRAIPSAGATLGYCSMLAKLGR